MDSSAYKLAISQPDAFRASDLAAISNILQESEPQLAIAFDSAFRRPVKKPELHTGSPTDDFFQISMPADIASEIADALSAAEVGAVSTEGHTTSKASQIASLFDRWSRYLDFVCH